VSLRPAAERAADPERHDSVADDVTEQTVHADDAMAIEERQSDVAAGAGPGQRETREAGPARNGAAARAADERAGGGTARLDGGGVGLGDGTPDDLGAFGVFG
jgi:hypothetical protein